MRMLVPTALAALLVLPGCDLLKADDACADTAACDDTAAAAPVDLLFVVDNSDSMQEEATELAVAFDELEATLAAAGVVEWEAGILTSSVYYDDGPTSGIDPGEAGTLVGGNMVDNVAALRENLLCDATCWDQNMPSDPAYVCGDPLTGDVSEEYLDCVCGVGDWSGNCGTGQEQGIEAAYIAMCRGVAVPPADCYSFPTGAAVVFASGDEGSNVGLAEAGADTLIVIVTDEGDSSLRTESGAAAVPGDVDVVVNAYTGLFGALGGNVRVSTIGPTWDGTDGSCLGGAQEWGVERYQGVATGTGGTFESLTDVASDCSARSMGGLVDSVVTAGVR
ncbi:MAG: hypothetical protein Q8P41_15815 [Pseudomonadota bacterium]|nr:hypothetical protein [Pseudomonadota bacterium]